MAVFRLRSCSHWPAKFSTRACAFGSASIRAHLAIEIVGFAQLAGAARREQLLVGHAAPEEVRQPRGQFVIVERADGLRVVARRVELDAEQKVRRDQHGLHTQRDGVAEVLAFASASSTSFRTRSTSAALDGRR